MELETLIASTELGVSQRQIQRLSNTGRLAGRNIAGRKLISGRSVVAASRSTGRGRYWSDRTVAASAELLTTGNTDQLSGSELSRHRSRLKKASVAELSYQLLSGRVTLWRATSATNQTDFVEANGLSATGRSLDVKVTASSRLYARRHRLVEDSEGDVALVELATDEPDAVAEIALYAYGDIRTSASAHDRIAERQKQLLKSR